MPCPSPAQQCMCKCQCQCTGDSKSAHACPVRCSAVAAVHEPVSRLIPGPSWSWTHENLITSRHMNKLSTQVFFSSRVLILDCSVQLSRPECKQSNGYRCGDNSTQPHTAMPHFVVVGAGPAGCTAALTMARLPGAKVQIIERRSLESLNTAVNNPRSYPMLLNGRSRRLFEDLGADLPCIQAPFDSVETVPPSFSVRPGGALLEDCLVQQNFSIPVTNCTAEIVRYRERTGIERFYSTIKPVTPEQGGKHQSTIKQNTQSIHTHSNGTTAPSR